VVFSFVVSALAAGFLETDIVAAYDRALHRNHGQATDRQAIWDTGSTVSDARQLLAKTSRRFDPGQFDRQIENSCFRIAAADPADQSDALTVAVSELSKNGTRSRGS
jgi:hypothetical protein